MTPFMRCAFDLVHMIPALVHPVRPEVKQMVEQILVAFLCGVGQRLHKQKRHHVSDDPAHLLCPTASHNAPLR
eukprot:COSAG02_NODE_1736_length_11157_cov_3.509586_5_plen_73_part_00